MYFCKECGFFWRTKQDIPLSHYEQKEIDMSPSKELARTRNSEHRLSMLAPYVNTHMICDIGCAEGLMLKVFKQHGVNAVGLEPSHVNEAYSRNAGIHIERGTIDDIPNMVEKYSPTTYTMFHVLEHVPDPIGSLTSLYSHMRPGDSLVIETPNFSSYSIKKSEYTHDLIYPEHLHYFSTKNLTDLLKNIGFDIVSVQFRDFDQDNMSIQEILFRLGLKKRSHVHERMKVSISTPSTAPKGSILKKILIKPLKYIAIMAIHLLRRRDYIFIIVKR